MVYGLCKATMPTRSGIHWVLLFLELLLPTGTASVIGFPTYWYMSNGTSYPCPDNCSVCVSDTNCFECTKGFFGPICENRCGENCPGTCHKVYGHCTEGCPDGQYPSESDHCIPCPLHCSLCKSKSKCVICEDGYFGEICQNRCTDHCSTCNKTNGQCLKCKDSYFKLSGKCRRCPYGCELCVSAKTCSQCKGGFFLHDGQCKCCPYGCRICITAEKCQSCEDGFQGPVHERCLYKCPSDRGTTYNVPYEDGRCGIWQDTTTNICHLQSESHSCTSSGTCLQDNLCPDSLRCVDETFVQASCATVMQYKCKHTCKQLLSIYGCAATCTVEARDNVNNSLLCMTDIGSIDANILKNTTEAICNPQQVTPTDSTSWPTYRIVLVVCVIVCVTTFILIVLLTCRRGFTTRNKSNVEEDSNWNELTRHDHEQTTASMLFEETVSTSSVDEGFGDGRELSRSQSVATTVC